MNKIDIFLNETVFCHGQLYAVLSKVTSKDGIKLILPADLDLVKYINKFYTKNIIYNESFSE